MKSETVQPHLQPELPFFASGSTPTSAFAEGQSNHSIENGVTFPRAEISDIVAMAQIEADTYPDCMVQGEAYFKKIISKTHSADSFLIKEGSEIAGYVLLRSEESRINRGEIVVHVHDLVILQKYRSVRILVQLMEQIFQLAAECASQVKECSGAIEANARESTSFLLLSNKRARRWYEQRGFGITYLKHREKYLGGEDFYFFRLEMIAREDHALNR